MLYDALDMSVREMKVRKSPKCPICGPNPTITGLIDYQEFCGFRGAEAPVAAQGGAITAIELKRQIDSGAAPFILDVRNPEEIAIFRIAGSTVIPMPELLNRLGELNKSTPMVVHCKSGARSARAIALLESHGFHHLSNLTGGILAWIKDVRPEPAELLSQRAPPMPTIYPLLKPHDWPHQQLVAHRRMTPDVEGAPLIAFGFDAGTPIRSSRNPAPTTSRPSIASRSPTCPPWIIPGELGRSGGLTFAASSGKGVLGGEGPRPRGDAPVPRPPKSDEILVAAPGGPA